MLISFIRCGMTGLFTEIFFTGLDSLRHRDYRLRGYSSIIMFPIYGSAALLRPLHALLKKRDAVTRGSIYTIMFFFTEYLIGRLLRPKRLCPWDYSHEPSNIDGLIRLDFAPLWFFFGLLMEHIACLPDRPHHTTRCSIHLPRKK